MLKNNRKYQTKFDNTKITNWEKGFEVVEIKSSLDDNVQKAYIYKTRSDKPKPLIVSLHTWSGDYRQNDEIAKLCKGKDINYIHPNFRGANNTKQACCSNLAINDIDDSILFAKANSNVDTSKIYIVGVSGGGYATLCTFMKSKHQIKKFSAWASITNLTTWYYESLIRRPDYAENILQCTGSEKELNVDAAKERSPIYWDTPVNKLSNSHLFIYAGIYDGIQGSVPIVHSINFYNKLLNDMKVSDKSKYITNDEKLKLLEFRKPLDHYGEIAGRKICLEKKYKNIKLVIFEGDHEILTDYALDELLDFR